MKLLLAMNLDPCATAAELYLLQVADNYRLRPHNQFIERGQKKTGTEIGQKERKKIKKTHFRYNRLKTHSLTTLLTVYAYGNKGLRKMTLPAPAPSRGNAGFLSLDFPAGPGNHNPHSPLLRPLSTAPQGLRKSSALEPVINFPARAKVNRRLSPRRMSFPSTKW
jgi:hypothetical protein